MTTNSDLTIFNARLDKANRRYVYVPTVIKGVSLQKYKGSNGTLDGMSGTQGAKVRVPITADFGCKKYIDDVGYAKLKDSELEKYWSIQSDDVFVTKEVYPEEDIYDTAVISKLFGECFKVTSYADNTTRGIESMKHWRIGGA